MKGRNANWKKKFFFYTWQNEEGLKNYLYSSISSSSSHDRLLSHRLVSRACDLGYNDNGRSHRKAGIMADLNARHNESCKNNHYFGKTECELLLLLLF